MKNVSCFICSAALTLFSASTFAQIGADTTFGDNGYFTNGGELDSVFENAYVVSDPFPFGDGGVIIPFVDGSVDNQFTPGPSLKLVRLNEEGSLSPTWGTDGVLEIAPAGGSNYMSFRDAIPVPDNFGAGWYILFTLNFTDGNAPVNYSNGGIVKIDSGGNIATQWADNGFLYWEGGNDFQQWSKLHINPVSNKLYVFGQQNISEIVRFTGAGQVDTTFFENGIFTFSAYDEFNDARIVAAKVNGDDSEGYFIFSGVEEHGCSWPCDARVSVLKMDLDSTTYQSNPGGSQAPDRATFLDTTFGTEGEIVLNPNQPADGEPDNWDRSVRAFPFDDGSNALVFGATTHYSDTVETARIYRFDADFVQDPNYGFGDANGRADLDYAAEKVFATSSNELYVFTNQYNGHYGRISKLTASGGLDFNFDGDGYQDFSACQDNASEVGNMKQIWSPADGVYYMLVAKQNSAEDDEGNFYTESINYGIVRLIDGGDEEVCGPSSSLGGGDGGGGESGGYEEVPGLEVSINVAGGTVTARITGIDPRMENGGIYISSISTGGPSCTYDPATDSRLAPEPGCKELAFNGREFCVDPSTRPPEYPCSEVPSDGQAEVVLTQLAYRQYDGTSQEVTPPGCDSCEPYTEYNYEIVYGPFEPTVTYRAFSDFTFYDPSNSTFFEQEAEAVDFQVSGGARSGDDDSSGSGSEEPSAPDADSDGVPDAEDDFPSDPTETTDTDEDGVGDNADAFPNDPEESIDADSDGVGANTDPDDNDDSFTGSPVVIVASDYSAVQVVVGEGQVLINGSPVTATTTSAAVAVGAVPNSGPSPEQVAELQNYADQVKAKVDAAMETGASSAITVVDTDAGASIRGLIAGEDVPIENIAIIEVTDPRLLVLVTGKTSNGELATITDGGVIEFGLGGRIVVLASGMTPGDSGEIVLFSEPDQLGVFDVDDRGVVQAEAVIPADIPVGDHTLVVAAPNLFSSLGFRVVASTSAPTPVPSLPLGFVWLLGLAVAYGGSRKLARR